MVDMSLLAKQLSALGQDLQREVEMLADLEEKAIDAEAYYRELDEEYEDAYSKAFTSVEGSMELRKHTARLQVIPLRLAAQNARYLMDKAKSKVRMQQASLQVLHRRCEIGRSLLSREKIQASLEWEGHG